jgi:hypothetical protein
LYTPENELGASDPSDWPEPSPGFGERCKAFVTGHPESDAGPSAGPDATAGTLSIYYLTQTTGGDYAPRNCTAVWIESADERFVATLEIGARLRRSALVYWEQRACTARSGPDVMTSATRDDHELPHELSWHATDADGRLVPDGPYRLQVELTETDRAPGQLESFEFDKGPERYDRELLVSAEGALRAVTIRWRPEAIEDVDAP